MDFLKSEIAVDLGKGAKVPHDPSDPTTWISDDVVQPFMIDSSGLHGRYVRLGPQLDTILRRHAYEPVVAKLLGEFLALSVGLSSALKYDGVFTLQAKGDGPVPLVVADVGSDGAMRGYAQVKGDIPPDSAEAPVPKLIGAGYLAFTVDFSTSSERHQGIVSLEGTSLSDVIDHYFDQSAQFTASARLTAGYADDGSWRAGALLVQHIPPEGGTGGVAIDEEDWTRAVTFMKSATDAELLDTALTPSDLLYRLYNEDGVRVFEPRKVLDQCRCSSEKMLGALATISQAEINSIAEDGKIEMVCEFCNTHRSFSTDDILNATQA